MKFKHLTIAATLLTLLAVGCSEESSLLPQEPSMPKKTNPYSIPLEEALANADAMLSNLSGPATRGVRLVEKVEVMRQRLTRAAQNGVDTALYLVNYSNNGGFALLAADRRLPEIFAFSDEGHFEFADTNENKALAFYMSRVGDMIAELPPDTIPGSAYIPPSTDPYLKYTSNYTRFGPFLTKEMSHLDQYAPYNKYVDHSVTGCVPIAFVAYLSHYRQPKSYGGYTFPWEEMRTDPKHDMIPRFVSILWGDKLLQAGNTDNGKPLGHVLPERYIPAFYELGITVTNGLQDFDPEGVCKVLQKAGSIPIGAPVLVRGNLSKGKVGHAWVVDGALKQVPVKTGIAAVKPTLNPNIPLYYFHCVWGWGGKNNGFFNFDNLTLGGAPDFLGHNDADIPGVIQYNFTYNLQYIGYITF